MVTIPHGSSLLITTPVRVAVVRRLGLAVARIPRAAGGR